MSTVQVCNDCKALAIDVLSGSTKRNARWRTISSHNATLSYTTTHLDLASTTLLESAARCQMCKALFNKLSLLVNADTTSNYHIFVWENKPERTQVQIATGDINRFIGPAGSWQRPQTLVFFAQHSDMQILPLLVSDSSTSNDAAPRLSHLPFQDPTCPAALKWARERLHECRELHPQCRRLPSKLPKRVLDLSRLDTEGKVSLCITSSESEPYTAISYTWGVADQLVTNRGVEESTSLSHCPADYIVKLLKFDSRASEHKLDFRCTADDIPVSKFPQTQQDALRIAKALDFRYIWVDSLCILQGDITDWADQGKEMTNTYGGAAVIISATCSKESTQGMLERVRNDRVGIGAWPGRGPNSQDMDIYVGDHLEPLDIEEKPLSSRGWVFQERLVSTATLHYTDEGMIWECAQGSYLAHHQGVSCSPWKANWRNLMRQASLDPSDAAVSRALGKNPNEIWYEWISAYSERNLYENNDKFPAIAGVAAAFARIFGPKYEYRAGLWKASFIEGLLWRRHNRTETLELLRKDHVAPSWSWGSVKGRLEYRNAKLVGSPVKGPVLKLLECNVEETETGSYGRLKAGGMIRVKGLVQRITVDRGFHPGVRQRKHQECGVSEGFVNSTNVQCMLDVYVPPPENPPPDHDLFRYYPCYCLRVGSHDINGREADVFLLLEKDGDVYSRVGYAETEPWFDRLAPTPSSGIFETASAPIELIIK